MAAPDFFAFFSEYFGERWNALLPALRGEAVYETIQYPEKEPYYLDEASAFAARSLGVEPGMDVLDMCAAPGGKTLILAGALQGKGSLQSNDRSPDRRQRLSHVLENTLPEEYRKSFRSPATTASALACTARKLLTASFSMRLVLRNGT